ncbi:unnamed protein product [Cochlearia groenlandica]
MEKNNHKENIQEELCSLSEILSSFSSSQNHNELNPLQEIFGSSSLTPKDVTNKSENIDNKSILTSKRQRSMDYRVMMEKKRRKIIRDKIEILQMLTTPNREKANLATKLESIIQYIKSLKQHRDFMTMAMAYTEYLGYMSHFYGAQAPSMSPPYTTPWCYYTPQNSFMPPQNMPFIPQFHQVHDTMWSDQTK